MEQLTAPAVNIAVCETAGKFGADVEKLYKNKG
jgi:hypothetical protein